MWSGFFLGNRDELIELLEEYQEEFYRGLSVEDKGVIELENDRCICERSYLNGS